jgi:hypothetical protein
MYEDEFYLHLKCSDAADIRKPGENGGVLYKTLCGHWVYDSIASDVDCPARPVTCPECLARDPHPQFQRTFGLATGSDKTIRLSR